MNRKKLLRLIGKECPEPVKVTEDQGAGDIMKRMMLKHKKCAEDYDSIAYEFSDGSVYQICERLFDFCKNNIYYSEETLDVQSVSAPQTILTRGHCDCKGYALFIAGVLDSLKRRGADITWCYRFASYKMFDETPGHVFVVVYPGTEYEIWVDPVLKKFNDHKEYCYHIDKKVRTQVSKISGCIGCDCGNCRDSVGATTAQTGAAIQKLAPALAVIPVVGWIASGLGEVIGGALAIFGDKFVQGPDIRWLIQLYQYFVLGNASVTTDNKVNENLKVDAWTWFTYVCGVTIYTRSAFNCLKTGHEEGKTTGLDEVGRAGVYVRITGNPGNAPMTAIVAAAQIAAALPYNVPAGGWSQQMAAPVVIDKSQMSATVVNSQGNLVSVVPGASVPNNMILVYGAAAIAAYLLFSK